MELTKQGEIQEKLDLAGLKTGLHPNYVFLHLISFLGILRSKTSHHLLFLIACEY